MPLDERALRYSTYAIAAFDLVSALLISVVAVKMLIINFNWLSVFLMVFSIFWTSVIILLFVGIWKRRPRFVRGWILFSCVGIVMELFLIVYGTFEKAVVDRESMKGVLLLFLGLIVESIFVYIVYKFYDALKKDCKPRKRCCSCMRKSGSKKKKEKSKRKPKAKKAKKTKKAKKEKKPKCPPEPKKKKKPKKR